MTNNINDIEIAYNNIIKFNAIFSKESIDIIYKFGHIYNITVWNNEKL